MAAAVCPHPPLLVPEVAGAAAAELDGLRASCDEAVRLLGVAAPRPRPGSPGSRELDPPPDRVVVVGAAGTTRRHAGDSVATLRPYGLDGVLTRAGPGSGAGSSTNSENSENSGGQLPLSLSIGCWLLGEAAAGQRLAATPEVLFHAVASDAAPHECLALGRELAGSGERVALLVMGDGSAYQALHPRQAANGDGRPAPHGDDARAAARAGGFDAAVAAALDGADAGALTRLDAALAAKLSAAGRPAWQVLAGAAGSGAFTGRLLADQAPYGVRYYVASWRRRDGGQAPGSR